MKNITLAADEALIDAARARAALEHTTLNAQFRRWLAECAHGGMHRCDHVMVSLRGCLKLDTKRRREEMNER